MGGNVAVVIPYFHCDLTELEKIAYNQCMKVLGKYPIILLIPDDMLEAGYPTGNIVKKVPSAWMKSVYTYNKMMLDVAFYRLFEEYEYILIYQLDAFVFCDKLEEFYNQKYDYIGAPWLGGAKYLKETGRGVWYVGNGGLSLRRIDAVVNQLEGTRAIPSDIPEDLFWASCAGEDFKVAPIDVALKFAFERDVCMCYEMNNKELPFGCHAWEKYNWSFWRSFFEKAGYKVTVSIEGNLDAKEGYIDNSHLEIEGERLYSIGSRYFEWMNKKVYIWGAGIRGRECGWMLRKCGVSDFDYVDINKRKKGNEIWGRKIDTVDILLDHKKENSIVIVTVKGKEKEILKTLEKAGYKYMQDVFLYSEWIAYAREKEKHKVREYNSIYVNERRI